MNILDIAAKMAAIDEVVRKAGELDGRGRTGGVLCGADQRGVIVASMLVGEVADPERAASFKKNGEEKTTRLSANFSHVSGWMTRDFDAKKYGGSVRDNCGRVFAFSGFSEHIDEALSAAVAKIIDPKSMDPATVAMIAKVSGNPHMGAFGL